MKKLTINYTEDNKNRLFTYMVFEIESISTMSDNLWRRLFINGKEVLHTLNTGFDTLEIEVEDITIQ